MRETEIIADSCSLGIALIKCSGPCFSEIISFQLALPAISFGPPCSPGCSIGMFVVLASAMLSLSVNKHFISLISTTIRCLMAWPGACALPNRVGLPEYLSYFSPPPATCFRLSFHHLLSKQQATTSKMTGQLSH